MIFIAPTDLSANMGLHGQICHPEILKKIEDVGQKLNDLTTIEMGETKTRYDCFGYTCFKY
jgi:2-keto-3-deoxy-L-rhamnonate aldolase RhmA